MRRLGPGVPENAQRYGRASWCPTGIGSWHGGIDPAAPGAIILPRWIGRKPNACSKHILTRISYSPALAFNAFNYTALCALGSRSVVRTGSAVPVVDAGLQRSRRCGKGLSSKIWPEALSRHAGAPLRVAQRVRGERPRRPSPTHDWLGCRRCASRRLALQWPLAEWEYVVRLARRLRLLARLGASLGSRRPHRPRSRPSAPAPARLSSACRAWRTSAMVWALHRIGNTLGDYSLMRGVLLKGAAYIGQDLPIAAGRLPSDIDILVPTGPSARRARAAVCPAGRNWNSTRTTSATTTSGATRCRRCATHSTAWNSTFTTTSCHRWRGRESMRMCY